MKQITIDQRVYTVGDTEFKSVTVPGFENLQLLKDLPTLQRIIELVEDIAEYKAVDIYVEDDTRRMFGGYLAAKLVNLQKCEGIPLFISLSENKSNEDYEEQENSVVISAVEEPGSVRWEETNLWVQFRDPWLRTVFAAHFKGDLFVYDNLLHLTMIVKDAGPEFEEVLKTYLPYIDKWTILDTGSTDGTPDVIRKVLGAVRGHLYNEPFVDFATSRNRCLDLAGRSSRFVIMLDDTYKMQGNVREILTVLRSDQYADSYSLYIHSDETEYISNRILKKDSQLRYIYKIHEIIQPNTSVIIPRHVMHVEDASTTYTRNRSLERKNSDLKMLAEEIERDPNDSRHSYYVAQTYAGMEDHKSAYEWYLKRIAHPNEGFKPEKFKAYLEAARTAQLNLNKPWEECEKLYSEAHKYDPARPEPLYCLGIHYYHSTDFQKAYEYFRGAYLAGLTQDRQYQFIPLITFHYVPRFLAEMCYALRDWELGEEVAKYFIDNNPPAGAFTKVMSDWLKVFCAAKIHKKALLSLGKQLETIPEKPVFAILGEYSPGKEVRAKYDVQTFASSLKFLKFLKTHRVEICLIRRKVEFLSFVLDCSVERIYLLASDAGEFSVDIIPLSPKIKGILGADSSARTKLLETFPMFRDRINISEDWEDEL